MPRSSRPAVAFAICLSLAAWSAARAQSTENWRAMNQPLEPFRIIGELYYVGANDVTAFLLPTPEGHILIDSGFEETVPLIRNSISKLGFKLEDVRILLNSHAHIDHAGGLAELKKLTGAKLMASQAETPLLEAGGRGDPLMGDAIAYTPVTVDRQLEDGDTVELGGVSLTARVTAGHTRGCTSWVTEVTENGETRLAVSVCSLSILRGTRLATDPTYPGIAEDFRRSYEILRSLPCDVFLASHAQFFKLEEKRARLEHGETVNPFIDRDGYMRFIERAEKRYEKRLEEERGSREAGTD